MNATNKEELTKVQRLSDGLCNYIDKNGKIISEQWFEWIGDFYDDNDDFALVGRENHEYNYIDKQGNILSSEWFRYVDYFDEYGLAVVQRTNGEQCKIDKTGKIVIRK